MGPNRSVPAQEEIEATYRILKGMATRKQFRTEQDREDFVQNVMLSAFRSYNDRLERALSFKNLACGPAFRRAYQTYWRRFYNRASGSGAMQVSASAEDLREEGGSGLGGSRPEGPERPVDALIRAGGWGLHEGDEEEKPRYRDLDSSTMEIEAIRDESSEDPADRIMKGILAESIEQLEPPYGDLIHCFLLGMTREEVATKMQKSVSWAKKYTLAALDKLVRQLKRRGVLLESFELEDILT
jgi:RNA polymerase sigma factor (sigma-70 family)